MRDTRRRLKSTEDAAASAAEQMVDCANAIREVVDTSLPRRAKASLKGNLNQIAARLDFVALELNRELDRSEPSRGFLRGLARAGVAGGLLLVGAVAEGAVAGGVSSVVQHELNRQAEAVMQSCAAVTTTAFLSEETHELRVDWQGQTYLTLQVPVGKEISRSYELPANEQGYLVAVGLDGAVEILVELLSGLEAIVVPVGTTVIGAEGYEYSVG